MVAQVDEQTAAMVAHAVDPAREADGLAHVRGVEFGAGMAAEGVHGGSPSGRRLWNSRRYTLDRGGSQDESRRAKFFISPAEVLGKQGSGMRCEPLPNADTGTREPLRLRSSAPHPVPRSRIGRTTIKAREDIFFASQNPAGGDRQHACGRGRKPLHPATGRQRPVAIQRVS